MVDIKELAERNEVKNYASDLLNRIMLGFTKFAKGSDVEGDYIRENLAKLNMVVENKIK
jgi:hypothetical protein